MSPLKSIRKKCMWCCCDNSNEVRLCPSVNCPLYKYRFGKGKGRYVKIIREKCKDCSDIVAEIKDCQETACSLFRYRMGRRVA